MIDSYFSWLENKYSSTVSLKKPIVIRLDGVGITKNKSIDVFNENIGEFAYSLQITAQQLSQTYNSFVYVSSDEISIIFVDTDIFYNEFSSRKCQKSSSIITQYVSVIFNKLYKSSFIYFDARTFNIPEEKVMSYIKCRVASAKNVGVQYAAKKHLQFCNKTNKKLVEIESMLLEELPDFMTKNKYLLYGKLYYNGKELDLKRILESPSLPISAMKDMCINKKLNYDIADSLSIIDMQNDDM